MQIAVLKPLESEPSDAFDLQPPRWLAMQAQGKFDVTDFFTPTCREVEKFTLEIESRFVNALKELYQIRKNQNQSDCGNDHPLHALGTCGVNSYGLALLLALKGYNVTIFANWFDENNDNPPYSTRDHAFLGVQAVEGTVIIDPSYKQFTRYINGDDTSSSVLPNILVMLEEHSVQQISHILSDASTNPNGDEVILSVNLFQKDGGGYRENPMNEVVLDKNQAIEYFRKIWRIKPEQGFAGAQKGDTNLGEAFMADPNDPRKSNIRTMLKCFESAGLIQTISFEV